MDIRYIRHRLIVLLVLLLLGGCMEKQEGITVKAGAKTIYFNLDSLITAQVEALEKNNPTVDKTMRIDGEEDEINGEEIPDWEEELKLFRQADINKPVLTELYQTERFEDGSKNGIRYSTTDNTPPVKEMELMFEGDAIQSIRVVYQEKNLLYESTRNMMLDFGGKSLIQHIEIDGFQKLIWQDSLQYFIDTQVGG